MIKIPVENELNITNEFIIDLCQLIYLISI